MLRRIVRLVLVLPAVVVLAAIGVANTQDVRLALDPFRPDDPALSLVLPFYVWLLGALILGVVVGGMATWLTQARWRRSARRSEAESAALEGGGRPAQRARLLKPRQLGVDRHPLSGHWSRGPCASSTAPPWMRRFPTRPWWTRWRRPSPRARSRRRGITMPSRSTGGRRRRCCSCRPGRHASRARAFAGRYMGLKAVTVYPDNATRGQPAVLGTYLLMSAETGADAGRDGRHPAHRLAHGGGLGAGEPLSLAPRCGAAADGGRRGAGAVPGARARLGATDPRGGGVEPLAAAGARRWSRRWRRPASPPPSLDDLAAAAAEADIVSTATLSSEPLIRGAWLKPGTHLDCVGAFKPSMRETDDEAARRARIFVDTRAGAFAEAGDILQPLQAGVIGKEAVLGELAELCRGTVQGRTSPEEITLFKSVGASIEDLAAAVAVYEQLQGSTRRV